MPVLSYIMIVITALVSPNKLPEPHDSAEYIIMPLDCRNQQEIAQVLDIFQDKDVQEMTNQSPDDIKKQIDNNLIFITHQKTICTYKDIESETIQGILISRFQSDGNGNRTYIVTLATHKDFRRKKVASSLLRHAENTARSNGSQEISLCVYHDNHHALKCYKNHGYTVIADNDSYLTMSKQLNS